jgi:hypothetical protein
MSTDRKKRFTNDAGTDLTFVYRMIEQDVENNTTTIGWTMRGKIVIPLGGVKFE